MSTLTHRGRAMNKRQAKTASILDLLAAFADEAKAAAWPESAVWNRKPACPHCGGSDNIPDRMVALAKRISDERLKHAGLVQ